MIGYSDALSGCGTCTGRWRFSPWTVWFYWFGLLRLEVEYQVIDMPSGVLNWRKATTGEWQQIIAKEATQ